MVARRLLIRSRVSLRSLALSLRVLGNGFRHFGTLLERLYDLPLFVPLWLESRRADNQNGKADIPVQVQEVTS